MRVVGSYPTVVLGISEQVPQDRRPGQNYEQVNFISDPVRGLARRHGSTLMDSWKLLDLTGVTDEVKAATIADLREYGEATFFVAGVEYSLLYRKQAKGASLAPAFIVYDKDNQQFLPVVRPVTDTLLDTVASGGVSAYVNVGKYLFLSGNDVVAQYTVANRMTDNNNGEYHVVWVRGGAYSRKFSVTLNFGATSTTVSYTTMASSYPNILDTSDIPFSDPNYNQKVSVRTNEYNSQVNKWIGDAAADIQPQNIASKLRDAIIAGTTIPAGDIVIVGSHVCIKSSTLVGVTAFDGGDSQLIRAVSNEVKAAEEVSQVHWPGKVVKVRPKAANGTDAYYLQAIPKDANATTWGEVTWRECAGYEQTPADVFAMATVKDGTFYIAGSPDLLEGLTTVETPKYKPNAVGDDVSAPAPYFFGKKITALFMFQDRLGIACDATVFLSKPGDYFNWFRGSVLTVADDDPVEMFAKGSEDDTIRVATTYDRNTLLFGDRNQYVLNGRQLMTPKNPSIVVLSAHEDAVSAPPINSGNYVFYGKSRSGVASLHQIQMGQLVDSPESYEVSQQLDRYLKGVPLQILALTAPNYVFLRTSQVDYGFYVYQYMDTPAGTERLFDAWSRWEWHPDLGQCMGLSHHDGDVLSFTVREQGGNLFAACDRFYRETAMAAMPYFDSMVQTTITPVPNKWWPDTAVVSAAFDATSTYFLIGHDADKLPELSEQYPDDLDSLWMGYVSPAYVIPTNPYVRDRNDKAVVNGRLTIARYLVSVTDTGGMLASVKRNTEGLWTEVLKFTGRILNHPLNLVGRQPTVTTVLSVPVMRETTEFQYLLESQRWLPLTISAIEWQGQSFNNARRV